MKNTDFRIGNYVMDEVSGELMVISELGENIVATVVNRDKYPLPDGWQMAPIPITAEWLLRCEFEISSDEYGGWLSPSVNDERWRVRPADGHFYWKLEMSTTPVIFSGVHHLQNWFYFLTGEELTVKEKV